MTATESRKWRLANPDRMAEHRKRWRDLNPEYYAAYNAARRVIPTEKQCPACFMAFTPRRKDTLRCSECRRHRNLAWNRIYQARRPRSFIGRTQIIGARDGWVCWICERGVDASLRYPDPHAASQDHVVPLSKGGSDDDANLRLAHFACNVRRGATDFRAWKLIP